MGKIKEHLKRNKKTYLIGGVCLVAGGVIGAAICHNSTITTKIIQLGFGNKAEVNQIIIQELTRRGHPGNVIRCVETGECFASQTRAADLLCLNKGELSKHLRGLKETVGNLHFEMLGEATA